MMLVDRMAVRGSLDRCGFATNRLAQQKRPPPGGAAASIFTIASELGLVALGRLAGARIRSFLRFGADLGFFRSPRIFSSRRNATRGARVGGVWSAMS